MSDFKSGGAMTTSKKLLLMGIEAVNEEYYYVGDDNHLYAFGNIKKELGDMLMEKYPNMFNVGGTRLQGIERFDLYETHIDEPSWTFEELWEECLQYEDEFLEYKTFEQFKKGEGFE